MLSKRLGYSNVFRVRLYYIAIGFLCVWLMAGYAFSSEYEGPVRGDLSSTCEQISLPFHIPDNDISFRTDDSGDHVEIVGFGTGGAPGTPALPLYRFSFLLPENVDWKTVEASLADAEWKDIPGEFDIAPALPPAAGTSRLGLPAPLGKGEDTFQNGRDITVYQNDAWFPASPLGQITPSKYREYNLGLTFLCPVAYNPVTKKIRLLRSAKILINFSSDTTAESQSVGIETSFIRPNPGLVQRPPV